ncbi:hypothetical protein CHKEEEPN_3539 [Methylorubrum podarium]|nr:hypothetical protein CHKEEEPN_3539 [Methylorubrum podarium]
MRNVGMRGEGNERGGVRNASEQGGGGMGNTGGGNRGGMESGSRGGSQGGGGGMSR